MPEISLPAFKGPLDLLLHLIEREDLDITTVSLVAVTEQYLHAIHDGEGFDPGALADFVSVGAKLIFLKSRALLPRPPAAEGVDDEGDVVGRELVDMLMEYRRFTSVTDMLERRQAAGIRVYPRSATPPPPTERSGLDGVTMDVLIRIMKDVLTRTPPAPRASLVRDPITLSNRLTEFRERLRLQGRFSFREAITGCESRVHVVISFLAVLELLKGGECDARQSRAWGDIEVVAMGVAA